MIRRGPPNPPPSSSQASTEPFEHLSHAPIVEAVIEIRARAESNWEEASVGGRLRDLLPDFPNHQVVKGFSVTVPFAFIPEPGKEAELVTPDAYPLPPSGPVRHDHGWLGLRLVSSDGLRIGTFTRDAFSFSRLKPYPNWQTFSDEALRLWTAHRQISGVSQIHRLGVRFINRLEVPVADLAFDDYFVGLGTPPAELPTTAFMYRNSFAVPGEPYGLNLVRTFQPPSTEGALALSLILDIDAFLSDSIPVEADSIPSHLDRLRTLKNQMFFGSLTEKALQLCR